ncbi:MAG: hypothetical protein H5T33_07015 [Candidatus Methanosuratus sp.]|nr:hypothetical protein [Candidatus Methanosuratincola sp.]
MENRTVEAAPTTKQLQALQQQIEDNYQQLNALRDRKNALLAKLSELQDLALNAKSERDEKNRIISEKKQIREQLHKEKAEISERIKALVEKKRSLLESAPGSAANLAKRYKELTWKYQTTSLTIEEDRKLVQEITELEKKLVYFKKVRDVDQEICSLRAKFDELRDKANAVHQEILALAEESKKSHEKLMAVHEEGAKIIDELNSVRAEMNTIWEMIKGSKVKLSDARTKYEITKAVQLQRKAQEFAERKRLLTSKRLELVARANEKLKKGERLTFEEYAAILDEKEANGGS